MAVSEGKSDLEGKTSECFTQVTNVVPNSVVQRKLLLVVNVLEVTVARLAFGPGLSILYGHSEAPTVYNEIDQCYRYQRRKPMNRNTKPKAVMRQTAIAFIASAGLLTVNVVSGDAYQDALKEAENESPHQRELEERSKSPSVEALEEAGGESPHQRELQERSRSPYEEDLQENQRERP
jgi:hypothetical protein